MPMPASAAQRSATAATLPMWRLDAGPALVGAIAIGLLMSTQFLFQVFVWTQWPWNEVLVGWLGYAGERVVVALAIGLAVVAASRLPARRLWVRCALLALAIVLGAMAGEAALIATGAPGAQTDTDTLLRHVAHWSFDAASLAAMFYLWRRSTESAAAAQAAEVRCLQAERQIAQAQLQALRSQIEPHFLFNTLATVRRLHRTEPAQGAQLLQHFLAYLRASLPAAQDRRSTLGDEIDLVRAYVGVLVVRMSGRLQVRFDVPDELRACEFPPLTLATLVENAVKHGIAPSAQGGAITVRACGIGPALEVSVADTGVGFSDAGPGGTGIGLANIRARLSTLYAAHGTLVLQANLPRGVCAVMRVPRRRVSVPA